MFEFEQEDNMTEFNEDFILLLKLLKLIFYVQLKIQKGDNIPLYVQYRPKT